MDYLKEFKRIMAEQAEMALATSVSDKPNVRIINFYFDDSAGREVLYFASFKDNRKIVEFNENSRVAFTTMPKRGEEHVRVTEGEVKKSALTIFDLKEHFIKKVPDYAMIVEQAGPMLELFEIHFTQARVTIDYTNSGDITLDK